MKTSRNIFFFTILNLLATIIFIVQLQELVVFGFLSNFSATQFINKWYNLIIPIVQVVSAFIIFILDVYNPNVPHKFRYIISWVAIVVTTLIMWGLMFIQYKNLSLGKIVNWPETLFILLPIALFMISEGYLSLNKDPKEFSIFGFKSVKTNNNVWKKVHKFAGKMNMLLGFVFIALAFICELIWKSNWIYLIAFIIWFIFYYLITTIYALSFNNN